MEEHLGLEDVDSGRKMDLTIPQQELLESI